MTKSQSTVAELNVRLMVSLALVMVMIVLSLRATAVDKGLSPQPPALPESSQLIQVTPVFSGSITSDPNLGFSPASTESYIEILRRSGKVVTF